MPKEVSLIIETGELTEKDAKLVTLIFALHNEQIVMNAEACHLAAPGIDREGPELTRLRDHARERAVKLIAGIFPSSKPRLEDHDD